MARLTEPEALAAESVDSLKRRFLRQNRDLIRTNATQALKIRALETQISNLLTENLSIRDIAIHLQTQLDESRSRHVAENIRAIQKQLEEKLKECTDIVAGLGHLDQNKRRRSSLQQMKQSPPPREWITRATLSEVLEQQPGHLPTIAEDKLYPRRTLESSEVRAIIEQASSESPEAGPPPTLHVDSIATESTPREIHTGAHLPDNPINDSGLLSVNFESRKRRRETYVRPDEDMQPTQVAALASDMAFIRSPERLQGKPIRANRRRRLSAHQEIQNDRAEVQDFEFTRKDPHETQIQVEDEHQTVRSRTNEDIMDNKPDLRVQPSHRLTVSPQRPVLGAKIANISPAKPTRHITEKAQKDPIKPNTARPTVIRRSSREDTVAITALTSSAPDVAEIDLDNIKLEPKTPAFADLVSPTSTQPSNAREGSRDTPPPGNIAGSHRITDNGSGTARPSRRARSAVNYAEPNLISKMRRPTKDLADAVVLDKKGSAEPESVAEGQQPRRVVTIKKEQEWRPASSASTQELSRPEPASPTRSRDDGGPQPASRHLAPTAGSEIKIFEEPSVPVTEAVSQQGLQEAMEALDIYDFKTSSPVDLDSVVLQRPTKPVPTVAAAKRRQSMAPTSSSTNIKNPVPPANASRPTMTGSSEAVRTATGALQRATSTAGNDRAARLSNVDKGLTARSRRKSMLT